MTVCEKRTGWDEATEGIETRRTQYCVPSRITEILMNSGILEFHAIRQVGKHRQLYRRVCGVSSAGEGRIFEVGR